METVTAYVSDVFILTTFATVAFVGQAIKDAGVDTFPSKFLALLVPFWMIVTASLAAAGFYARADVFPPRIAVFAVLPALLVIGLFFIIFRQDFIERLPLSLLTLVHVVRIPVELVLLWLSIGGLVPKMMTFEGRNFDIVSGILALMVWLICYRFGRERRWLLIGFNLLGLALLVNIVTIAVLSMPSPMQQLALDQPNRAVALFPYIWLPAIIVPVVLFSNSAALWKLLRRNV